MKIMVTGGAGFIGSAMVRLLIEKAETVVINVDKLTYASHVNALDSVVGNSRYHFVKADLCNAAQLTEALTTFQPDIVMHLAAETHVDRSIDGAGEFIRSNIVGTFTLLEAVRSYYCALDKHKQASFRFHHVSTDEVFGDLGATGLFTEESVYAPSSPYSASKASSDHLVRAWHRTYGLPIVITNCSNNYGPYQHHEKLIPLVISNALAGKPLPIYGDGKQIRDWLYVEDHALALYCVAMKGEVGKTYNIGARNERTNIEVVHYICDILESLVPNHAHALRSGGSGFRALIEHVTDRLGHDTRYAIDSSKIEAELGWQPLETFESGLRKTIQWYVEQAQTPV